MKRMMSQESNSAGSTTTTTTTTAGPVSEVKLKVSWNSRVVKKFLRKYDVENFTELSLGKKVESEEEELEESEDEGEEESEEEEASSSEISASEDSDESSSSSSSSSSEEEDEEEEEEEEDEVEKKSNNKNNNSKKRKRGGGNSNNNKANKFIYKKKNKVETIEPKPIPKPILPPPPPPLPKLETLPLKSFVIIKPLPTDGSNRIFRLAQIVNHVHNRNNKYNDTEIHFWETYSRWQNAKASSSHKYYPAWLSLKSGDEIYVKGQRAGHEAMRWNIKDDMLIHAFPEMRNKTKIPIEIIRKINAILFPPPGATTNGSSKR